MTTCSISPSCFFFSSSAAHRDLHSFPTRRSSDLDIIRDGIEETPPPQVGQRAWWLIQMLASVPPSDRPDRKSTRLNSSHRTISYAVFCLKKKKITTAQYRTMIISTPN